MNRRGFFGALAQTAAGIWVAPSILIPRSADAYHFKDTTPALVPWAYVIRNRDGAMSYELSTGLYDEVRLVSRSQFFSKIKARNYGMLDLQMPCSRGFSRYTFIQGKPSRAFVEAYFGEW